MAFVANHGTWTVVCASCSAHVFIRKDASLSPFKCLSLSMEETVEEVKGDKSKQAHKSDKKTIQTLCCRFSRDGTQFAVATNQKKCLVFDTNTWTQLFCLDSPKAPSAVDFVVTHEKRFLIVADRAGNVIQFPLKANVETCPETEDAEGNQIKHGGEMILGHLSVVLDVKLSADEKFLLTTDRDEKVRISNYPHTFVIHSFCLGHTEYVRSIAMWDDLVVSAGGDGAIKFWTLDGQCVFTIAGDSAQPKGILKIDLAAHMNSARLAVALEDSSTIVLHDLTRSATKVAVLSTQTFEANAQVWDLGFAETSDAQLFVLTCNSEAPLLALERSSEALVLCDVGSNVAQSVAGAKTEMPPLKKVTSFNNVEAYHQRKSDRITRKRKLK